MRIRETEIAGVRVVEAEPILDRRGWFARAWDREEFAAAGLEIEWVQANAGYSERAGTLRGLHYQRAPWGEHKLVWCTRGAVFDVAVDLRPDSPTVGGWTAIELTAGHGRSLLIPPGCAHGYLTTEDSTELFYLTSRPYVPAAATGVRHDDPAFGIRWPRTVEVVSDRDASWPAWKAPLRT
jgi:dTDP-4-dehydrorhamnose 3,5-epimerase